MNIRNLPIRKIIIIFLVLAFIAASIATFVGEYKDHLDRALHSTSSVKHGFLYDGEIYVYNTVTNYNWMRDYSFLRKLDNMEDYISLHGTTIYWSDAIEKFVYAAGGKIKTYDINAKNSETLHRFSIGRSVILSSVIDKYALVRKAVSSGTGHIPTGSTYILNLETGDAVETPMPADMLQRPMGISGNYLYFTNSYVTVSIYNLYRCDLTTGECELLIDQFPQKPGDSGCIIGDFFYFYYYDEKDVIRYSLSSGEFETSTPGTGISYMTEYKGNLLIVYYTRTEADADIICHVCTYDFDNQKLEEIGSAIATNTSTSDIRLYDGLLVASASPQAFYVELSM